MALLGVINNAMGQKVIDAQWDVYFVKRVNIIEGGQLAAFATVFSMSNLSATKAMNSPLVGLSFLL